MDPIILLEVLFEALSIISLSVASLLFLLILLKYYRGMKTPPFWIYVFGGFLLVTLFSILSTSAWTINRLVLSIIRFFGFLLFLVGVAELFRFYRARIKFDKK